jgi:hypothetical protein
LPKSTQSEGLKKERVTSLAEMAMPTPPSVQAAFRCDEEANSMCDKVLGTLPPDLRPIVRDAFLELGRKCHAHMERAYLIDMEHKLARVRRKRDECRELLREAREERLKIPPPPRKHTRLSTAPVTNTSERREKHRLNDYSDALTF